jgi:hypothetical protein
MMVEQDIDLWIRELSAAGWRAKTRTMWQAPGGDLWIGPAGAWKEMRRRREAVTTPTPEPEPCPKECRDVCIDYPNVDPGHVIGLLLVDKPGQHVCKHRLIHAPACPSAPKPPEPEPPIDPATDEEIAAIAAWNCDCRYSRQGRDRHAKDCLMVFGPRLIARIEAESTANAALKAEVAITKSFCNLYVKERNYERVVVDRMAKEKAALQAFKNFVHRRLDEMGVPANPEPPKHALEGCRIGDRLDFIQTSERGHIEASTALRSRLERVEAAARAVVANCNAPYDVQRETMHALESILSESEE